jgi:hypothetical protein
MPMLTATAMTTGQLMLTRLVNRIAQFCYWLHETRRARLLLWFATLLGAAALLFARPGRIENATVRDYRLSEISISSQNAWARVNGVLLPDKGYQTRFELGNVTLRGSKFIPLTQAGAADPLFVLDEDLPSYRPGEMVTLVGQIQLGQGEQPPIFLQPGLPPNVVLANWIARIGAWLLMLSVVFTALSWLVHFSNYALPAPAPALVASNQPPRFLWYGDLGREYGDVVVREVPCDFTATVHEAQFSALVPRDLWKVCVRRLRSAQLLDLATQYGSLPAARILFEDERGLMRRAVFAANSMHNREQALQVMSLIR